MSNESASLPIPNMSTKDTTSANLTLETFKKRDLDTIPPCFFVGPHETEKTVTFEPELNNNSGSIVGYGERRLSNILAETTEVGKKEEGAIEIPSKRVILDAADANRGVFGDKRVKVAKRSIDNNLDNITASHVDSLEPSKTIRVFGYPSNLLHNVIEHFMTYGKIECHHVSPGNWMTITYESSTYALAALKSNGIIISKTYMIGVSMEENSPNVTQNVIPLNSSGSVFKSYNGLGSGKVGPTVADKHDTSHSSNNGIVPDYGILSKLNDTLFGW